MTADTKTETEKNRQDDHLLFANKCSMKSNFKNVSEKLCFLQFYINPLIKHLC